MSASARPVPAAVALAMIALAGCAGPPMPAPARYDLAPPRALRPARAVGHRPAAAASPSDPAALGAAIDSLDRIAGEVHALRQSLPRQPGPGQ